MIDSQIVKINKKSIDCDNLSIENHLKTLYKEIIRWAIVSVADEYLEISVSFKI